MHLSFSRLSLHFVMVFFAVQTIFKLMYSHVFIFSFVSLAQGNILEKNIAERNVKDFTASVFFQE